jgi:crotonobetainyl-CoA:carnitine CoA-transferase CaiB-like acyl-CoA transferase
VYEWEQTRSQQLLLDVQHATAGPLRLPGVPLRFDGGGRTDHLPPPTLGQHDAGVREWLDALDGVDALGAGEEAR